MSDSNNLPVPPPIEPSRPSRPGLTLAALIVGILAFIFAIIPGLSFIAFVPAIVAAVLGIAGLVSKARGLGMAIAAVIIGPLALLVAIIVSLGTVVGGITPGVDSTANQPDTTDSTTAPGEEPAEEPAADLGTRSNPAPTGSTVVISDNSGPIWEVTVGVANLNAGDAIAAENQFNPVADAGSQYVLVPVTYTYVGATSGTPWIDVQIEYVSAAGTTHEQEFVVVPTPIIDIAELYEGASATGNLVVMAPSAGIEGGAWAISTFLSEKYFVKVA